MRKKKVIFAVGGTGGHVFPAQALAKEIEGAEILFAGHNLGSNPYFDKEQFSFREVESATPSRKTLIRSGFRLLKGLLQSLRLNRTFAPDLIIGFGSFYSFPLLLAARIQKIPYLLVESNVLPGKVNRIFSKKAELTAIQFSASSKRLNGPSSLVKMPKWAQQKATHSIRTPEQAREYFGLDPHCLTLLVLGGSQGARAINEGLLNASLPSRLQILHLCGKDQDAKAIRHQWQQRGIRACVKLFEENMHLAWLAADLTVCRAGAGTCAEVVQSKTPALFVPWPGASEGHQRENALYFVERGGAFCLEQSDLVLLEHTLTRLIELREDMKKRLEEMDREAMHELSPIVMRQLH